MKWMRLLACGVAMLLGVAGCVPQRVSWSPDGSRALVLGGDGLHLFDVNGKIGPMLAPQVSAAEWLPDGKGMVVVQEIELKTWKEVTHAFPAEALSSVSADRRDKVRAALLAYDGDWSKLAANLGKQLSLDEQDATWTIMALRDAPGQTLEAQLGNHWGTVAKLTWPALELRKLDLTAASAKLGPVLLYLPQQAFQALRVSPDGQLVAVSDMPGTLAIVSVNEKENPLMLGEASLFCDWAPDGKHLVYIRPVGKIETSQANARFGTLSRRQVTDAQGKLLSSKALPPAEDLVGLLYDPQLRVRVAKDGRIYFASAEITLPATVDDFITRPQLYCIDPGKGATVARVVPRSQLGKLGNAPQFFELSPDGARISVPFEDGRVSVVDVATGKVDVVQGNAISGNGELTLPTVPVWRSATELTFVRPEQAGARQDLVLYSLPKKSEKVLSRGWPREIGSWAIESSAPEVPPAPPAPTH